MLIHVIECVSSNDIVSRNDVVPRNGTESSNLQRARDGILVEGYNVNLLDDHHELTNPFELDMICCANLNSISICKESRHPEDLHAKSECFAGGR